MLEKPMGGIRPQARRCVLVAANTDEGLDGQTGIAAVEVAQRREHLGPAAGMPRSALPDGHGFHFRLQGFQGFALRTRPFRELTASRFFNALEQSHFSNDNQVTNPSKNKPEQWHLNGLTAVAPDLHGLLCRYRV
jgi:hypothetical protein